MQTTSVSPAGSTAGNWFDTSTDFLDSALNMWGKVEAIKAQKSASGGDQVQRQLQPEISNGAAVQVDQVPVSQVDVAGLKINKNILVPSLFLLGAALLLKRMKF